MKNYFLFLLFSGFILAFSNSSSASNNYSIESMEIIEDQDIRELLFELFIKLDKFAWDNQVDSPQKKMAYLLTMATIIIPTTATKQVFQREAWSTGWHIIESFASPRTQLFTEQAIFNSMRNTVKTTSYLVEVKYKLKHAVENIDKLMNTHYEKILSTIDISSKNNFLEKNEDLSAFYNTYFGELKKDSIIFFVPWLVSIVPVSCVHENHRALFLNLKITPWKPALISLLLVNKSSDLSLLNYDIINYIINNIICQLCK